MKEIKIYADVVDPKAMEQFEGAMAQPFAIKGALLPDVHAGYSLPIGAAVATDGVIVPAWVGYDIGCGMCAEMTDFSLQNVRDHAQEIYEGIYKAVPVGFKHNLADSEWGHAGEIPRTSVMHDIFSRNGFKQLGTLGGGNHFIELGYDEEERVWIIVHSGSRGIGHTTATHYMRLTSRDGKAREGHFGFSVNSEEGKDYIKDLNFCLEFALANRNLIIWRVVDVLSKCLDQKSYGLSCRINRNHNHAELKDGLWIHRKGATHAEEGMLGVIPGNMRDGSFIVRGKGNSESLCSSSHGAGRVLGRKEAQRQLDMGDFTFSMLGVTANVSKATLDESPEAYKNIFDVMDQQKDLVEVLHHIKPIINIKG